MPRRKPLTRDIILEEAVTLADSKGMDALSMRSLAKACGVEAMSLYNHVANKEAVLQGMIEVVVADIYVPGTDAPWKEAMRRRAFSAHYVLMQHPWASMVMLSQADSGPVMLGWVDATIGCLRNGGFSWALADHAWNTLDSYIHGFTQQRLNFPFEESAHAAAAQEYLPLIPESIFPNLHGMATEIAEGRHDGIQDFSFGLELLLDGLERVLASYQPGQGRSM